MYSLEAEQAVHPAVPLIFFFLEDQDHESRRRRHATKSRLRARSRGGRGRPTTIRRKDDRQEQNESSARAARRRRRAARQAFHSVDEVRRRCRSVVAADEHARGQTLEKRAGSQSSAEGGRQ